MLTNAVCLISFFEYYYSSSVGIYWHTALTSSKMNMFWNSRVRYKFIRGDIRWTNQVIMKMTVIAVIGGMISSLVGLGGGVVFNPLMIGFGVHPQVSTSTSMYMIMLSTFSAVVQFFWLEILPLDYTIGFGMVIIIATILGNIAINNIIKKLGTPSSLALFIASVMIMWTIIVFGSSVFDVIGRAKRGENLFSFKPYWR